MRFARGLLLSIAGAFGGAMAAAAFVKRAMPSRGDEESDEVALAAIYDGIQLRSRATAFRGGSLLSWYGGVEVDLSEATLAPEVQLTIHSLFGGVAVRLPADCRIESSLNAVMGGVAVSKAEPDGEPVSTIKLDGLAVFGGIAVGRRDVAADSQEGA